MGDIVIRDEKGREMRISHADFRERGIVLNETGCAEWLRTVLLPLSHSLEEFGGCGRLEPAISVSHPEDSSMCNRMNGTHFSISHSRERYLMDQPAGEEVSECGEGRLLTLPDGTQLYIRHEADNAVIDAGWEKKLSLLTE